MAKKKNVKVNEILFSFAAALKKEIPVEKIFLFGSYATKKAKKDSDIDVIVVSPSFKKERYMSNMQYLFRKASQISSLLEPIPASPADVKNPDKRVFLGQIIKSAKEFKLAK